MKILCLIDTLGLGGAERQMIGLALFLREKGYNVTLVSYYSNGFYSNLLEKGGIRPVTLHVKDSKWSKLLSIKKFMKDAGNFDCVIAYKDGPALISCILKILGGNFKLLVSERNTNLNLNFRDRVKFFLYRWADKVIPNAYAQERFIKNNFPGLTSKVVTITNFTDLEHFQPIALIDRKQKITIVTVARIAYQKNILNYLEAIKLLKRDGYSQKLHFDWYGDVQSGEENYGLKCFDKCKDLDIEDMIEFHPATSEIVKIYQACDIFCLPSIFEGFPNVICEAMSCGKPIVCSDVCDNAKIVENGKNAVLFDPNNIESIYQALKDILSKPEEILKEWSVASRDIAEKKFSKKTFVQKYINEIEVN